MNDNPFIELLSSEKYTPGYPTREIANDYSHDVDGDTINEEEKEEENSNNLSLPVTTHDNTQLRHRVGFSSKREKSSKSVLETVGSYIPNEYKVKNIESGKDGEYIYLEYIKKIFFRCMFYFGVAVTIICVLICIWYTFVVLTHLYAFSSFAYKINDRITSDLEEKFMEIKYTDNQKTIEWLLSESRVRYETDFLYNYRDLNEDLQIQLKVKMLLFPITFGVNMLNISNSIYQWVYNSDPFTSNETLLYKRHNWESLILNISISLEKIKQWMYDFRDFDSNRECVCAMHIGLPLNIILIHDKFLVGPRTQVNFPPKLYGIITDPLFHPNEKIPLNFYTRTVIEHASLKGKKLRTELKESESMCLKYCLLLLSPTDTTYEKPLSFNEGEVPPVVDYETRGLSEQDGGIFHP